MIITKAANFLWNSFLGEAVRRNLQNVKIQEALQPVYAIWNTPHVQLAANTAFQVIGHSLDGAAIGGAVGILGGIAAWNHKDRSATLQNIIALGAMGAIGGVLGSKVGGVYGAGKALIEIMKRV